jgi:Leucine-rich repeat (LRR) protein
MSPSLLFCKVSIVFAVSTLVSACGQYPVTLNERPLYSPPDIYNEFTLADEALKNCVRQTLLDQKITKPEQLKRLICRYAGISNLEGLNHFFALQELDLAHNNLQNTSVLAELKELHLLKLSENPKLDCSDLAHLKQKNLTRILPEHCSHAD